MARPKDTRSTKPTAPTASATTRVWSRRRSPHASARNPSGGACHVESRPRTPEAPELRRPSENPTRTARIIRMQLSLRRLLLCLVVLSAAAPAFAQIKPGRDPNQPVDEEY